MGTSCNFSELGTTRDGMPDNTSAPSHYRENLHGSGNDNYSSNHDCSASIEGSHHGGNHPSSNRQGRQGGGDHKGGNHSRGNHTCNPNSSNYRLQPHPQRREAPGPPNACRPDPWPGPTRIRTSPSWGRRTPRHFASTPGTRTGVRQMRPTNTTRRRPAIQERRSKAATTTTTMATKMGCQTTPRRPATTARTASRDITG